MRRTLTLLLAAAAALLSFVFRSPPPWQLDAGSPEDVRFLRGFYPPETGNDVTFRWSGPEAQLALHGAQPGLVLALRLNGSHVAAGRDHRVFLQRRPAEGSAGETVATFDVQPGWRDYRVKLPAAPSPFPAKAAPLSLVSAQYLPDPSDGRPLGVMLQWIRLEREADSSPPWSSAGARAFPLAWGLAVLAATLWRINRVLIPGGPRLAVLRVGAPVGVAAVGLALWAHHDPYSLAWSLPPLPWTLGLATAALVLLPRWSRRPAEASADPPRTDASSFDSWAPLWLAAILLVALGMRFHLIRELPYGLWRDEARHGLIALRMLEDPGYRPVYVAEGGVNMPALGLYPFAFAHRLWGIHPWSMRTITALAGALTVLPLYWFLLQLTGRTAPALLAAAFLAVSSWHLVISRFSFPAVFDPLLSLTALGLLLKGLRDGGPWSLAAGGVSVGVATQTYHSGRVVPLVAALLVALVLRRDRRGSRRWLTALAPLILGFFVVAWPVVVYALRQPAAFNDRVGDVFLLRSAAANARAPLSALDDSIGRHVLMFHVRGDENGRHHAPGRPMLDGVTGLGFLVGCFALLRRPGDVSSRFLLGALAIGLLPSLLAVEGPHAMRSIGAAPFACAIAAFGWEAVGRRWDARRGTFAAAGLVAATLVLNYRIYFVVMPVDPRVWETGSYPVHTQIGAFLREKAARQGRQSVSQTYVSRRIALNSVFAYLAHNLPVPTFDGPTLSHPVSPVAEFVLSAYTHREEAALLAPYLGPSPSPQLYGAELPGGSGPSFFLYRGLAGAPR